MPAPRNRKHVLVKKAPSTEPYKGRRSGGDEVPAPRDRATHARLLRDALQQLIREEAGRVAAAPPGGVPGTYVRFESRPDVELKVDSLENKAKGIALAAVQALSGEGATESATVFVPPGQIEHFVGRIAEYETQRTKKGKPKHKDLLDPIGSVRRATLQDFWTDASAFPGAGELVWWEVWLRREDGREIDRLRQLAAHADFVVGEQRLLFDDRTVVLVRASAEQLATVLDTVGDLAELRRAAECVAFFTDLPPNEQKPWIDDLRQRTTAPRSDAPAVCLLDTGVNRGHPLIEPVLAARDATAVNPQWGPQDDGGGPGQMGHGTAMAGLAAFGDLAGPLAQNGRVAIRHCLESVKILPPTGANDPRLYGLLTAQAVAQPEVTAPTRARAYSLAVTSIRQCNQGEPSSWSAAIDAITAGRSIDATTFELKYLDDGEKPAGRLLVVSAGNVGGSWQVDHLARSDMEMVYDPAQAWNVLTVGAFTEKAVITSNYWADFQPVARPGDLSPWSSTSVLFAKQWPLKPDVVFEGGNLAHDGTLFETELPDLSLLSTHFKPAERLLGHTAATSAATAQVARIAALIHADYPEYWPETVRALVVHSARWTRQMEQHLVGASGKRAREALVRRYGFGVPDLERARRSANDALTLVIQGTIHPFESRSMREMHFHELPWPKAVLEGLGSAAVKLRVTLSYFIEPNPGHRGWRTRHRYQSHGLRFDVISPTENIVQFRKRLNEAALDEDEERPERPSDVVDWFLGPQARNRGSLHSDLWVGSAADLAAQRILGIYPVGGWWKEIPKRDRSALGARYSLVVSIETEEQNVDLWTPVATEVGVPVEVTEVES